MQSTETPITEADRELLSRMQEPRYWIESNLSIVDKDSKRVPFLFNAVQSKYWGQRTRKDVIVKAKKQGFSALTSAEFLHSCVTRPNTHAVIVSHEEGATKRLLRRVKEYIKYSAIPVRVKKDSENELSFPDTDSWYWIGTAGQRAFGRGDDITHAHLSEFCWYPTQDVCTAVLEGCVNDPRIVFESTANGAGTPSHQFWLRSVRKENDFKDQFFGWQDSPEYSIASQPLELTGDEKVLKDALNLSWAQIAWRRWKIRNMADPSLFPQEYPATWEEAFLASGRMLFDWVALKSMEKAASKAKWRGHILDRGSEIAIEPDDKGPMVFWETPKDDCQYLIVADAADGIPGAAWSVADVYDVKTWEQVAQWRGHIDPAGFGDVLIRIGAFYSWATVAVENETPGNATLQRMVDCAYPNLHTDPDSKRGDIGFPSDGKSRNQYIADGRDSVKDLSLKLNSMDTINEMRTFCLLENNKMGAQPGCWQDTVIVACKAASLLKRMVYFPESDQFKRREIIGRKRRPTFGGSSRPDFHTGVV